ncbi:stealth family protein [Turicibacter sanguinis]|uniref:stealth family protein n=1 Tax=Turicibacter sanguinis TaxID=154288 RepID=UPI0018AABC24|nr:stealth family protein [Turicibacter sanguinis]
MEKIDFIITWVDGDDPQWISEFEKYTESGDNRKKRYRDWELLRYWFRAIELYAPWVNKIFFVTFGHIPPWLNLDNEKLIIVNHKEFIPEEYLPTFSSRAIDLNFHRIDELSENFVYFNDDMFILQPTKSSDFFKNNLPCDTAILNALYLYDPNFLYGKDRKLGIKYTAAINNLYIINKYFNKQKQLSKHFNKWFNLAYGKHQLRNLLLLNEKGYTGFMSYHLPYSYCKQTYRDLWDLEFETLNQTCLQKFRTENGVNNWLMSYWQLAKGEFTPRNPKIGTFCGITNDIENNEKIFNIIRNHKYKLICISDEIDDENFEKAKNQLKKIFSETFPEKSSFEK